MFKKIVLTLSLVVLLFVAACSKQTATSQPTATIVAARATATATTTATQTAAPTATATFLPTWTPTPVPFVEPPADRFTLIAVFEKGPTVYIKGCQELESCKPGTTVDFFVAGLQSQRVYLNYAYEGAPLSIRLIPGLNHIQTWPDHSANFAVETIPAAGMSTRFGSGSFTKDDCDYGFCGWANYRLTFYEAVCPEGLQACPVTIEITSEDGVTELYENDLESEKLLGTYHSGDVIFGKTFDSLRLGGINVEKFRQEHPIATETPVHGQ